MPMPDFSIDLNRLDQEWLRQDEVTQRAGEAQAEARAEHARVEKKLKVYEANLRKKIRTYFGDYGFEKKPTKDEVDDQVLLDKDYQKGWDQLIELKLVLDLASVGITRAYDRRKALENEVTLLQMDYRSEPKHPDANHRDRIEEEKLKRVMSRGAKK